MFPNNGPVAALSAVRSYVAQVGLNAFPEEYRPQFQDLLTMQLFEALTAGVERLYAAVRQLADLPNRMDALMVLGEASQASALASLEGKAERRWAIQAWALAEVTDPGVDNPAAPAPDIEEAFSFIASAPPVLLPVPDPA